MKQKLRPLFRLVILAFAGCNASMVGMPIRGGADVQSKSGGIGLSTGMMVRMQGQDEGFGRATLHTLDESVFVT